MEDYVEEGLLGLSTEVEGRILSTSVIGASLSEPHTSGTALRRCVRIRPTDVCVYD